jgi:protein involved in polysaccharide export with SLBB domain
MQPILLDVPYTPGLTVLRLLERFGGPTPLAETERSFIIRAGSGERSPIPDLGEIWDLRQWERDVTLAPGDRLVIPMKRLLVSVGGEVNNPGAFSFTSGYEVSDYLDLAGAITEQDGSAQRLFLADSEGGLTRVAQDTEVSAGASIYVGRSAWGETKRLFANVFTVTGWVTGVIAVTTVVIQFIQVFIPGWP